MVGRSEALNLTMEAGMKLVPLTVKVKPWLPTCFDAGEMSAILGTGLLMLFITEQVVIWPAETIIEPQVSEVFFQPEGKLSTAV